ncbi:2-oxoglutarate ferredoxin oxidoreductase subunit gamma [Pyrococcus furiosus DSM 3638]|uniref:Pyruvate/ketoisovalerate oxidoreductases common subunit gamma n=3 Tax=Pyrococcus furiosus TaxID=2261 RepID=Q8U044_PYRFU|nr:MULTISPECIES: 2-oxoacid:ferredoxin oxidoreductase subunit gamma [Pyrococcus]AAL81897.1 2-keto acid:ferredoxin oxidoreductase subunit gamma [Pyrococcus furiosus DSM 3638]AFN04868.1 2-oxoglutarate ferredoxin oxidoreductase subunit gamma [Pyrococcus furiosus COM1]MDK2870243.1 2-oxoglutarate ferredoxin oxidoreductase subunit gamma [Pyrococcus sp.]QEK79375.1 2-oxoglutarate ferredoxin oxidoreductase subunit gamma [Pyrococcus furiosus DSM 3638]
MRKEILLGGFGGQGIILASVILGRAAAVYEGLYAVQTQAYGPESRGGASRAEVVISDEPIDYPKTVSPDYAILLSQQAYNKYLPLVKKGGIVILEEDLIPHRDPELEKDKEVHALPLTKIAEETTGLSLTMNILTLGYFVGITKIVKKESIEKAVLDSVPKGTEKINLKALHKGFELSEK